MWSIDLGTLDDLELGAAMLGSGGGGDTRLFRMLAEHSLDKHGPVTVLEPDEAPDGGMVVHVGLVGALTAFAEKPMGGQEFNLVFEEICSLGTGTDQPNLVASYEGAGANALIGVMVASQTGTALVDVSGMGRALPLLDQTSYAAAGLSISPFALRDSGGNAMRISSETPVEAERILRANTALMGGWAAFAGYRLSVPQVRQYGVQQSLRRAVEIGAALAGCAEGGLAEGLSRAGARHLGSGRIIDVEWQHNAFSRGSFTVRIPADGRQLRIEMQSEFLVAIDDGAPVASTPDIICILDQRSMKPFQAERVARGSEVHVISFEAPRRWLDSDALPLVCPEAFGYNMSWVQP